MSAQCLHSLNRLLHSSYQFAHPQRSWLRQISPRVVKGAHSCRTSCAVSQSAAPPRPVESVSRTSTAAAQPGFKASLDFRAVRDNIEAIRQNVRDRNSSADPDRVCQLYDEWRQLEDESGRLRNERNQNSKAMKVPAS